jgi:hypothetical protein
MSVQIEVRDWVVAGFAIWGAISAFGLASYGVAHVLGRKLASLEREAAQALLVDAEGWEARQARKDRMRDAKGVLVDG